MIRWTPSQKGLQSNKGTKETPAKSYWKRRYAGINSDSWVLSLHIYFIYEYIKDHHFTEVSLYKPEYRSTQKQARNEPYAQIRVYQIGALGLNPEALIAGGRCVPLAKTVANMP